jgi:lipopolysaccharide transport system ATP-binding protein
MKSLIVDGVSKRYWVPKVQKSETTESRLDRIRNFFSVPLARELIGAQEVWALKDVSFDVEHGTVLGVIGGNGAGKTTLLKVISKVIAPTTGRIKGKGRVVSLLELGAGFDDEATARENIFMNAAINGIPRAVALERFKDIIDFAEVQEFVDTPLQYFSSGMYLRLAFSVAINMQPSILLADEILAVGDLSFQERCLQRVRELARDTGLTVLFVSHDMEAVSRICDRVIWVKDGTLHRAGEPEDVVTRVPERDVGVADVGGEARGERQQPRGALRRDSRCQAAVGRRPRDRVAAALRGHLRAHQVPHLSREDASAVARSICSRRVCWCFGSAQPELVPVGADMAYEAVARIPANLLSETTYTISVGITLIRGEGEEHALVVNKALAFMVYRENSDESSGTLHRTGLIDPTLEWSMEMKPYAIRA